MSTEVTERQEDAAPVSSFFSQLVSFVLPTAHAEEAKEEEPEEDEGGKEEEGDSEEEEEEEEPEDLAPAIREECEQVECTGASAHFKHCAEKVEGGKGWHGEDCVEELFHLMHCVDACAAPKLFKKLV